MNRKEIFIICLIMCCIFSLHAVAATSDLNTTDDDSIAVSDVSSYSLPDSDDSLLTGSEDADSFTNLQDAVKDGGEVNLTKNYTYGSSDSGLKEGVLIDKDTTIDGNGKVIIDGSNQARIFNISEGVAVTLKGITFINGNASGNGGSICSHGVLTIIDCKFINNTAAEHGGAIYLDHSTKSSIENCEFNGNVAGLNGGAIDWRYGSTHGKVISSTFTNNTAKRSGGAIHWSGHDGTIRDSNFTDNVAIGDVISEFGGVLGGGDGGAVIWVGSTGTVDNCRFIHNEAKQRGGAIFLHGNSTENCTNTTVSNSIFNDNIAGLNGGAVDWQESAHDGNIYNTTFTNNRANGNGGAVFWAGHDGEIYDSNFTNNTAKGTITDTHGNVGDGGAIIWSGVNGTVTHCRFINNSADNRGGAVYLQNCTHDNCTNTTFEWCTFINNTAGVNGGALDWHDGAHDGNVYNSTFTHNTAGSNGGAIFWSGHNGRILDSNFTSNTAKGLAIDTHGNVGDGGAIIWSGINGTVDNCRFIDNEAMKNSAYDFGGRGGAVYLQNCTHGNCENTTFTNVCFENNVAGTNGGALDWHAGAHDGLVENGVFVNNTAKRSGGAIFWDGHNGTIRYSKFYDNHALGEVNATSVLGPVTDGGDGGAVMWSGALGDVEYCNFVNNTAAKRGGAVFLQASEDENYDNTTFRHSYFKNNTAGTNGGAIDWNKGAHNGLVDNVTFVDNTAMRSGGAIFWFGTQGVVNNSKFTDNHALGITEAINSFGELTYGGHGGAIMWTGANGTVENSTFDRNDAKVNGGAIFLQGSSEYGNCENVTVTDSRFTDNVAGVNGGAIDWYRGARNGTVSNCNFDNNTAKRSGGAIFWFGRNGTIEDSNFTNNRALGQVLYNDSYGNETYGGNGGAIMWTGYHGTVKNCTFETNFAENNGGGVYLQGSDMGLCIDTKFDNCTFIDNTAGIDGGAVNWYIGARNGTVLNSNFINNTAVRSGGAVSWNGIGGNISYCNFTGNKALGAAIDTEHINFTSLTKVHEVTHLDTPDSSTLNQLYVLVTKDGQTKVKYELYVTVPDPIDEFAWLKYAETDSTDPSAIDWATDEYFGGDGGSILWGGDNGVVDHCIFIGSDSARRGGGAYMRGSDNITFSNCYFENSTSGTNGGGLDWLAGANYGKVINCTFNNTRAARSAGAIYYDGDYGEMANITIINATAFGGALKESEDHKVQYAGWDASHWDTNTTGGDAGAIMFTGDHIYVYNATFINCTAAGRGGAVFLQDNENVTFELCVFEENSALGTANNTWKNFREERNDANPDTKVDYTLTGHGGAIAFDVGASDGYVIDSLFNNNHAHRDGGAIYYASGATRGIVINSTFINHTINYDGGAIYLNGTYCEIHNSTFLNNSAKDDGGAIFWQGNNGIIYNITCDLNHGLGTGAGGGSSTKGGVICLTGSDVSVDKSTFTNSYGGLLGGTIFVTGDNVNITNSVFKNSTIGISDGGALYLLGDDTLIRNCTFDNCTAPSEGGAIYVQGDRSVLDDSTITNSTAINGGAIYIEGNEAKINNTQISNVNASVYGGSIHVEGDDAVISVNITDSSVSGMDNYVPHIDSDYYEEHIADLLNKTDEMIVFISNMTCEHISQEDIERIKSQLKNIRKAIENVSTAKGGINSTNITIALGLLDELNQTLAEINATLSPEEYKENTLALFNYVNDTENELKSLAIIDESLKIPESILDKINSMIANLDTLESQGVPIETILDLENALQSIKDAAENIFLGNKFNLAALNLTSGLLDELNQTLTVINATLSNNALDELFKGIEDTRDELDNLANIVMDNVVIPKAYGLGGAVYISGDRDVIRDSHVTQTTAYSGGAVYISGDDAAIENSDFKDVNATNDGGALFISGDGGKLYNSNFTHNFAGDDGGAIYWSGDHGTIDGIICSDNHGLSFNGSSSRGGAICLTGDDVTISKSEFNYNNVSYAEGSNQEKIDGGALFITGNDVIISETEFSHNNASHYGGTIYILGNETVIDNCTIDHSNAIRGGAIYVEGENATISAGFENTNATLSGGAIYVHGENARIVNSTFDTTYAFGSVDNGGGAIMVNGNFTSIENSNFTNTHADNNHEARGGAIYIKGRGTNITDSSFEHSRSNRYGGSIYINGTNTTIRESEFTDCTVSSDGSQGGAIYVNGEYTTIIGSDFDQNTAKGEGGAIYIHGLNTTISNSTFEENNVDGNGGGAIYVNGDNAVIEGSNFTKNEANIKTGAEGGAIYVNGEYTLIDGSNFADSSAKFRGGAIYIDGANAKVKDSNFTNSSITGGTYDGGNPCGGAIYINKDNATIVGSVFKNSTVLTTVGEGGAIYIEGQYANIMDSQFESSHAKTGGTIYIDGANALINGSSANDSYASEHGGAVYATGLHASVYNSNFTNNLADGNGGAIFWAGGSASQYNTIDGCIFTNNTAHGITSLNTKGGGALYFSENGQYGTLKNSKFYYNSVQANNDKADGGAVLWDKSYHILIDHCDFIGNYLTTKGNKVWVQGGAMYLRAEKNYTVSNCLFENCSSAKEAGALYIQSNKNYYTEPNILIVNTTFRNNVAKAVGENIYGGGAVQVKECDYAWFENDTFINNTANQGGAISVYLTRNSIKITDNCTFIDNKATNRGGAIYYSPDNSYKTLELTDANFINNTANLGGAIYVEKTGLVIDGTNFTSNKAYQGSAIYATQSFTLRNSELIENRANSSKLNLDLDRVAGTIDILFEGWDNYINAIYATGGTITCTNVDYWDKNTTSSGKVSTFTGTLKNAAAASTPEVGIGIIVELFDDDNNKLNVGNDIFATIDNGRLHLTTADFELSSFEHVYVTARLTNEDYYTQITNTSREKVNMDGSALDVIYHRNATVDVTISVPHNATGNAARGIVSVYYNDTFLANITIEDSRGMLNNISTLIGDRYLEVGKHNLTLRYWGDLYYDAANITIPINVVKAQSNITITYDDLGYDVYLNVTIVDDYDGIYYKDAEGDVLIEIYSQVSATPIKTAVVHLVNGNGVVKIEKLLPSNYTAIAYYNGDHNYNASVNSTSVVVREKADAIVDIQVSAYDIMVDETVYINITLITPPEYTATGNVTLYLDNDKYILLLNDSKAYFNVTGLPEGRKIITVCYDGNEQLIPTSNDATFWVHKYNTTIEANATNITHIQHEVINITLLNDTVGVVSIFVNDEEYFARISNGTAILELPLLPVGEYNVTVVFPGDDKYNNNTTSTKFNVLPVTPEIVIDVENVTYGESVPVVVTLINCAEGNVTIEIDGTPYGDPKPVNNGRVEFVISDLAAGNYNLKAIYSGDANHTAASAEQDFTVYKAGRTVTVDVYDIVYGDVENINIHVNATGNVTIKVNGKTIEDYRVLEDNSTKITLANLAANTYNVEVIYNGNENYTESRATATFRVSPMDTSLVVDVHELWVWDKEYINIEVRNSTGDVATNLNGTLTINIDGINHYVRIINGTASFNITENSVGERVVWVFYEGDGNFSSSKVMETYKVLQRTPSMEIIAHDIIVGQDGNITVNLPSNATGYVEIEVEGVGTYYSDVSHGQAAVYPKNLKEGYYKVTVRYHGDAHDNYTHVAHIEHFTVSKAKANLTIDVNDTVYGNDSNIVVYVDDGVEGSITIKINDTLIGTYGIVDGKVNITVRLPAGNYTVHAEYGGSYGYDTNVTSKDFNVAKATPVIAIDVPQVVDANTNATIVVRINDTATGNITITVNGTKYNATIENGVAIFTIDKLLSGKYNITAEYAGDNNYTEAAAVTLTEGLTVDKVSCYQINVTANDTEVGLNSTIVVRVPADAVGNVSIYVDGKFAGNATISQGIAQLNVTRPYGNHTVNVTFTDGKYGPRYAIADFWVFKHESPIVIDVDSILVGDVAYINVTAPSDNVTIEINGKTYTRERYEDGIAYFEVSGLEHGNKTVVAIYAGNDNYTENTTTGNFTVSKRGSYVNVDVTNCTVAGGAFINVTVPDDAEGYAIVSVNNINYTVNLTDGKGNVTVYGLPNGTYDVYVTYIGDEKYLPSNNVTESVTVSKLDSFINVEVREGEAIVNGSDVTIIITAPDDITGKVNVTIDDGVKNTTYTVFVNEGEGILHLETPEIGIYNVTARYLENDRYLESRNSTEFEVYSNGKNLTVKTEEISVGGTENILVEINGNHTGEVRIIVKDSEGNVINDTNVSITPGELISAAELSIPNMDAGNYTVEAIYLEVNGTKVIEHVGFGAFKVDRLPSEISIKPIVNVTVGENVTIELELTPGATGNITVFVNGVEHNTTTSNLTITIPNLGEDEYIVHAFYYGDKDYYGSNATGAFRVDRNPTPIIIDVEAANVGDIVQINVTVPDEADGQILLDIGDQHVYANITGGVARFNITGLKGKEYNITATYLGNYKYLPNSTTSNVTISKKDTEFTITPTNITVGADEFMTIETDDNITSLVKVEIDGKNYTAFISEGKGNLTVPNLSARNYNATLYFEGNEEYNRATAKANFTVNQTTTGITIVPQNITFGDKETITVYIDATGSVNITVDGETYADIPIVEGKAEFTVPGYLYANNYTVRVDYNGNVNYTTSFEEVNFTVAKATPELEISVQDIPYGDIEHIIVTVRAKGDAQGSVNITVNGNTTEINLTEEKTWVLRFSIDSLDNYDANAKWHIENLEVGEYPVSVTYNGNENFNQVTGEASFRVYQTNTTIDVEVSDIQVWDKEVVNITVHENATGNALVYVDGSETPIVAPITQGIAQANLTGLSVGRHSILVVYEGDRNFTENWTSKSFSVTQRTPTINVTAQNITVGDDGNITVSVPANATGYVVIEVIGDDVYYRDVIEGTAVAYPKDLKEGTYTVRVTYVGDEHDNYTEANAETDFKVSKVNSTVEVKVANITLGDVAAVNITVITGATGNVTITIGDEFNKTVGVIDGVISVIVPGLTVGDKTVNVTYNGNDRYLPSSNSTTFNVGRMNLSDMEIVDNGNGTVTVILPKDAQGNVTVYVDGKNFTANVTDGIAVIDLENVTPGTHNITAVYSGDGNYTNATANGTVTIPRLESDLHVNVTNIKVGDTEIITVELPENATGDVTIEINGVKYEPKNVTGNVVRFEIDNLTYGNKTAYVKYSGDGNYTGTSTSANFTVDKRNSTVTATIDPIKVGEDALVVVSVPENATGWVHVTVGNHTYAVKVDKGTGNTTIPGLASGTHPVMLEYLGDDQYLNSSNSSSVTVSRVPSNINVTVDNIKYGETAIINVETPEDLCGNVTVTVDGKPYTVFVSGGHGVLPVSGLKVGNHTVNVTFDGCRKYGPCENSTEFNVTKMETTPADIKVVDLSNGTVVVVVPGNASGNVTIKVGDELFNATVVNGTAVVNLDNVTPGTHDVEVFYSGDDIYSNATVNATVTAPKYETPITVTAGVTEVGDIAVITVEVPNNATGNITIEIDGVKHNVEIKDGVAVFNVENLTEGIKTIAVEYPGDDNYASNHTVANLTMEKRPSWVTATIEDIDVGENVTITVHVPENATGQVLIDIDGVGYYVNVTGGVGTTQIPRMPNGTYNVNLTYTGDGQFLPSSNSSSFNVSKVPSFVIPIAEDINVGENEIITFIVPEDATGNITIIIDGDEYNFNLADGVLSTSLQDGVFITAVSGGKGKIGIYGLPKGNYNVTVRYNGDGKYKPSDNKTSFKVSKSSTTVDVIDLGNGTVMVNVGDNASGNVTVKIGDQTYNATVVNGTAIVPLTNATPGTHEIEVTYSGDDTHGGKTVTSTVTIPKHSTPISVKVSDIYVGDTAVVTVTLPKDATGTVTIEINGKKYSTDKIVDGKAVFNVKGLAFGDKTVAVTYSGDDNYEGNYTTGQFKVKKRPSTITADAKNIKVGNDEVITVTVPSDATGRVCVKINGVGYYGDIVNGKAKIIIPELPAGKYKATVTYEGDDKYLSSSKSVSFTVSKSKASISAIGDEINQGEDADVVVKLPKDATGKVTINVAGKKYAKKVKNGKATFSVPGLSEGVHKVMAHFHGDRKYDPIDTVTEILVHDNGPGDDHGDVAHSSKAVTALEAHQTGNPLWLLLLVILAVVSTQIRRFRK